MVWFKETLSKVFPSQRQEPEIIQAEEFRPEKIHQVKEKVVRKKEKIFEPVIPLEVFGQVPDPELREFLEYFERVGISQVRKWPMEPGKLPSLFTPIDKEQNWTREDPYIWGTMRDVVSIVRQDEIVPIKQEAHGKRMFYLVDADGARAIGAMIYLAKKDGPVDRRYGRRRESVFNIAVKVMALLGGHRVASSITISSELIKKYLPDAVGNAVSNYEHVEDTTAQLPEPKIREVVLSDKIPKFSDLDLSALKKWTLEVVQNTYIHTSSSMRQINWDLVLPARAIMFIHAANSYSKGDRQSLIHFDPDPDEFYDTELRKGMLTVVSYMRAYPGRAGNLADLYELIADKVRGW